VIEPALGDTDPLRGGALTAEAPTERWLAVGRLADVPRGRGHLVPGTQPPVAVFRVGDDVVAVANTCTHKDFSLCDSVVQGGEVVCGWHGGAFCLRTGVATRLPARTALKTYRVEERDGVLYVAV
jgi:nitrite reductase/ring-hydroxylating ferredoxin subunit